MHRGLTLLLAASLVVVGSATGGVGSASGPWEETRFHTGCDPGPYHDAPPPEHRETHYPPLHDTAEQVEVLPDAPASVAPELRKRLAALVPASREVAAAAA